MSFSPNRHFNLVASPFVSGGKILQHQISVLGIDVVALNVQVKAVDVQNDILRMDYLRSPVGSRGDGADNGTAGFAGELETGQRGRVLRALPVKMKVPQPAIATLFARLDDILDEGGGNGRAHARVLGGDETHCVGVGGNHLAPARIQDVRVGLEDRLTDGSQLTFAHGELRELRPAN